FSDRSLNDPSHADGRADSPGGGATSQTARSTIRLQVLEMPSRQRLSQPFASTVNFEGFNHIRIVHFISACSSKICASTTIRAPSVDFVPGRRSKSDR
ncbi:MAG: hypothetical protein K6T63_05620, partial [Alicyclobacillus herbarius]|uniref:hypothetical protein n=1 Tax=Alicyclobacillus herbarius TaxID=122960 RepID=UPI002352D3A7